MYVIAWSRDPHCRCSKMEISPHLALRQILMPAAACSDTGQDRRMSSPASSSHLASCDNITYHGPGGDTGCEKYLISDVSMFGIKAPARLSVPGSRWLQISAQCSIPCLTEPHDLCCFTLHSFQATLDHKMNPCKDLPPKLIGNHTTYIQYSSSRKNIVKPWPQTLSPKPLVSKPKPNGLGLTLKSHGPPPHHPTYNF